MREIRLSGSVRGADREVRPYRDLPKTDAKQRGLLPDVTRTPHDGEHPVCPRFSGFQGAPPAAREIIFGP
jgi:hypothetical protein